MNELLLAAVQLQPACVVTATLADPPAAAKLALAIHERTRELGLLRAVGQSRSQVRSTVRWESVIVSVFGTVCGVALGSFLGWGVMEALASSEGFGAFTLPTTTLGMILGLAALAGVVAAIRPARRATPSRA